MHGVNFSVNLHIEHFKHLQQVWMSLKDGGGNDDNYTVSSKYHAIIDDTYNFLCSFLDLGLRPRIDDDMIEL